MMSRVTGKMVGLAPKEGAGVVEICNFRAEEPVRLDPDRLVVLYAELGQNAAERVICAAMEDLAVHLAAIEVAVSEGELPVILRGIEELSLLARQVGMIQLVRVARDLGDCAARGDLVAQAAVLARLRRTAEGSLTAVWDLSDMSG